MIYYTILYYAILYYTILFKCYGLPAHAKPLPTHFAEQKDKSHGVRAIAPFKPLKVLS